MTKYNWELLVPVGLHMKWQALQAVKDEYMQLLANEVV